jgi:hypothetical protein
MSYSQDLCTTGLSGAFQGQVFGLSGGRSVRDENCERLKLSKYIYDMGMKVAAVSILCQDERVFKAMMMAGTPCPYEGKTGKAASVAWVENIDDRPDVEEYKARLKREAKKDKANKKRQTKKDKSDKKKKDKADAEERARVAKVEKKVKDEAFSEFLAVCTLEPNPTRERIQRDVVGAIDSIVTPKTKTSKQCAKEYESISS